VHQHVSLGSAGSLSLRHAGWVFFCTTEAVTFALLVADGSEDMAQEALAVVRSLA
jgi:hypothetical protein